VRFQIRAGLGNDSQHLVEDVKAGGFGAVKRFRHDLRGDAADFDVHLQSGDAVARAGDFEVHIPKVVFGSQNVRQDDVSLAFLDQPHRHA